MIDSLVQYLLEEVAMDGDEGTSIRDLASFISEFYASHSSTSAGPSGAAAATPTVQQVDDSFLSFIWDTLVDQPDVRVGLLRSLDNSTPLAAGGQSGSDPSAANSTGSREQQEAGGQNLKEDADEPDEDGGAEEESDLKTTKKARKKPTTNASTSPTHELTLIPAEMASMGYGHLSSVYATQGELRVVASPETAWKAITGSHARPSSLTPPIYQVLQMVSRGRAEGATAVRLSRELGVDPKSVFHYIKIPQKLGIVKKIPAIDQGCRTNRILHVRYLSASPHWAAHTASEPAALSTIVPPDDGASGDEDGERPREGGQMSTISALYLSTNPDLIRNRVVRALKARGDGTGQDLDKCWMIHSEMASSIGLHSYSAVILRRLNAIIHGLTRDGVVEKIAVSKKNRKLTGKGRGQVESVTTLHGLKLIDPSKLHQPKSNRDGSVTSARVQQHFAEDDDDHSYPLANKSVQRQVLDLLIEADTRGLTNGEICDALGGYTVRSIDAVLQRLGRQAPPAEYFDSSTTSMVETVGRVKHTRWFSLRGYIAMRRERGAPDQKAEKQWEAGKKAYDEDAERRCRRETELERGDIQASQSGQWSGIEEKKNWLRQFKTMDHVGRGIGEPGSSTSKPRKTRAVKTAKRNGPQGGARDEESEDGGRAGKRKPAALKAENETDPKGKGKAKALDQDERDGFESAEENRGERGGVHGERDEQEAESGASETPEPPKPRGRPRKTDPIDGKESWYQRKKRLDAERVARGLEPEESYYARKKREDREDREREAAGLPPLVRQKQKRGPGRKTSEAPKAEDEADQGLPCDLSESPVVPQPRKRGRPRKLVPPADNGDSTDQPRDAPPKRKRGRPSKLDRLAAVALEAERSASAGSATESDRQDRNQEPEDKDGEDGLGDERPKKRTRFSLDNGGQDLGLQDEPLEQAPPQPPRRRGRSSGPPLVPGPELDGAPVREPAPEFPVVVETPPVTPPGSPPNPRRRARVEPVVEIEVRSPSKEAPRDPELPRIEAERDASASPKLAQTVSGDPPVAEEDDAAVAIPEPEVRKLSPPPIHRPSSPVIQTVTAPTAPKTKARKSVTSKDNLTALSRQKEILDFITAQGGIIDAVPRLGLYIRDHLRSINPLVPIFQMDRHVVTSTLSTLVKREQLRKTSILGSKGDRHDIYYNPTIALDGPEMVSFLDRVLNKKATGARATLSRADEFVVDGLDHGTAVTTSVDVAHGPDGGGSVRPDGELDFPQPGDDPLDVKDYFRQQLNVIGASNGAIHGPPARARRLHKWLASLVFSSEPSDLLAGSDDAGHILTHDTFVSAMPLAIFTAIVPLPVESDELRQFLEDPNNHSIPLRDVPPSIRSIIRPNLNKRKEAVWKTISTLMLLKLVTPLVETAESMLGRTKSFVTPPLPWSATHWRFNQNVPVYAYAQDPPPLASIATLDSFDAVSQFWKATQELSIGQIGSIPPADPVELAQSGFPLHFTSSAAFLKRLQSKSRWSDCYYLLPDQRRFLGNLVRSDPDLVHSEEERSRELEVWADAVYAPRDAMVDFMRSIERKARRRVESEMLAAMSRNKRRRVRETDGITGDYQGRGQEEWEDVGFDEASFDAAASALHRKVQEVAAQRARDWTTIVDRFRNEHKQAVFDANILSYLQRRFIDPRRQIDAVQLMYELRHLLPEPAHAPGDEGLRTVVPLSLRRQALQARDPYAILRQPTIRKRIRSQPSKALRLSSTASRSPSRTDGREEQSEFSSQRAGLGLRSKRPRSLFTPEQDELIRDGLAILKARAQTLNSRLVFAALEQLLPDHAIETLRRRSITLVRKTEELEYHDRLVDAWLNVYRQRKESDEDLDDPNWMSMSEFDIASFVRCLRQHVDKRAVRLSRTLPRAASVVLPASLAVLRHGYTVKTIGWGSQGRTRSKKWDNYWVGPHIASTERDSSVARASFATSWIDEDPTAPESSEPTRREQARASAAIKMVVSSSDDTYSPDQGVAMLSPFAKHVDEVVQQLRNQRVIISVSSEPGRRIPGRNYSFDDKFFDRLDSTPVTVERISDAAQFENQLRKEHQSDQATRVTDRRGVSANENVEVGDGSIFPVIPTEGEMMALIDLVSNGEVNLAIDTSTVSEKVTRIDDFATRQATDEDVECTVQIEVLSAAPAFDGPKRTPAALPRPETFMPPNVDIETGAFDAAKDSFFAAFAGESQAELVRGVLVAIESSREAGITLSELCERFPLTSRSTILACLYRLLGQPKTSAPHPLIFVSGFSRAPVYIATVHIAAHAIPLPRREPSPPRDEDDSASASPKWLLPCAWVGSSGELNRDVWAASSNFVRGLLFKKSGSTFAELGHKASSMAGAGSGGEAPVPVLSTYEVRVILETFEKHGIVGRNAFDARATDEAREIDWEKDRWSLKGCFWNVGSN